MRLLYVSMIAAFLISCGNSTPQNGGGQKPATNRGPTEEDPNKSTAKDPVASSNSKQAPALEFAQLAAVLSPLNDGNKSVSLAAKAKATGKPYTVFQFSGVTCESCKVDSPIVQYDLAKMPQIARVVIFPNQPSEYSEAEYKGFIDQFAPGADRLVDGNLSVLKAVRKDKTQFFGLYIVVRASDGKAVVLNSDDAHLKIASAVKDLK